MPLANETELKIQETSYLDARCYGSADYRHGPIATAQRFVPYLFFLADEKTGLLCGGTAAPPKGGEQYLVYRCDE